MADIPLRWHLGMDTISSRTNLPDGAVVDCVNTDIDRANTLGRRKGYSSVQGYVNAHSLWTSDARPQSFAVLDGVLCRVQMPWQVTPLYTLTNDAPFKYDDMNGDIICGSRYETLLIDEAFNVRKLGLETPGAPSVTPGGTGGLDAGTYGVAIAYLRGSEEGALSRVAFTTLTVGQGLSIVLPQPLEDLPTGIRIYRTNANGDILHRVTDVPLGLSPYLLGVTPIGRQCDNYGLERMISGDTVHYWRGLVWSVRGQYAFFSEPFRFGVYNPRFNFIGMPDPIIMFLPLDEKGIYVGTRNGIYWVEGNTPKEFEVHNLGAIAPIKNTGVLFTSSLLGVEGEDSDHVAAWLSGYGFVVGTDKGQVFEKQRKRIVLEGSTGAAVVHNRRITATVL